MAQNGSASLDTNEEVPNGQASGSAEGQNTSTSTSTSKPVLSSLTHKADDDPKQPLTPLTSLYTEPEHVADAPELLCGVDKTQAEDAARECANAAEVYWQRSACSHAVDMLLGVVGVCSSLGSLAIKFLPSGSLPEVFEHKHLLPVAAVSLTIWWLGGWGAAAKKSLELHNKYGALARRALLIANATDLNAETTQKAWNAWQKERTKLEYAQSLPPWPCSKRLSIDAATIPRNTAIPPKPAADGTGVSNWLGCNLLTAGVVVVVVAVGGVYLCPALFRLR